MPVKTTFPGVYVQEEASGIRPIAGVSTGTALFIGASRAGPLTDPTLVLSHDEFLDHFGGDPGAGDLSRQVKLFFQNGGRMAYVMRIADGATSASVTLLNETDDPVLDITAANPGQAGEQIRIRVTANSSQPDETFDMEIFTWAYDLNGTRRVSGAETFTGLSMDPDSTSYAPKVLTQNSRHVDASEAAGAPDPVGGALWSGLAVPFNSGTPTSFRSEWAALIGDSGPGTGSGEPDDTQQTLLLSVDGGDPVGVVLNTLDVGGIEVGSIAAARTELSTLISQAITDAHDNLGRPGVTVAVSFEDGPDIATVDDGLHGGSDYDATSYLRIASTTGGEIVVRPEGGVAAQTLRLGVANGGRKVSAHAHRRPAPNATLLDTAHLNELGALTHAQLASITLDGQTIPIPASPTPNQPIFTPSAGGYATGRGGLDGIAERLRAIRDAINTHAATTAGWDWAAALWGYRLALWPTSGNDNRLMADDFATGPDDIAPWFTTNTRLGTVGVSGASLGQQVNPAVLASDGDPPVGSNYDEAYPVAAREIDVFNLLVLPHVNGGPDRRSLWGPASIFCQQNRAVLLVDPPETWVTHTDPIDGTGAGDSISDLRIGLVKDHAAIAYPNLVIDEDGLETTTSPAGAIAGLCARIDAQRGVWKAPSGTEADVRGIVGVTRAFSDAENGFLNPRGVNVIRRFPTGIVNWGARTADGDDDSGSEYKYLPVRRLLLYLEESIYRGLQWTVFEPNGTELWGAIRVNVGNFLEGLRRQGAFAGTTASQSYYVRCDETTTTPTDRNLGVVNVHIGVATLKPAEFVVLSFRQITLPEQ